MQSSLEQIPADILLSAAVMLGESVTDIEKAAGGANNRVYRVRAGRNVYALKLYPATAGDTRDRLGAETAAISFMQNHGVRIIPALVGADLTRRIGLYEWIDGEAVGPAGDEDIAAALRLLAMLHPLRLSAAATELPHASEACLAGSQVVAQIERRLERLQQVAIEEPNLAVVLTGAIVPALKKAKVQAEAQYTEAGLNFAAPIDPTRRTLSPSDFGFHNARRRADRSLIFYDFEYFGWDDPVKPVCDFVLHPGMTMSEAQRGRFVAGAAEIYGTDETYRVRLRALYPLFGLRWCLILLNEFLPERWARRVQAGVGLDRNTVFCQQLAKAEAMSMAVTRGIAGFPYDE
jgi:hypothetical protein